MLFVDAIASIQVAVCGLPDPMPHHAVVMARFARDCIAENGKVTKELEVLLGPDTGDLKIRIGLHSGPITAGKLRFWVQMKCYEHYESFGGLI